MEKEQSEWLPNEEDSMGNRGRLTVVVGQVNQNARHARLLKRGDRRLRIALKLGKVILKRPDEHLHPYSRLNTVTIAR